MKSIRTRTPRAHLAIVALAAASLALTACGGSADSSGGSGGAGQGSFTWAYSTGSTSLDPHNAGAFDLIFMNPGYETLIRTDEAGNYVPGIASKWALSKDARTLTLTLRQGVNFQDGGSVNAKAVKASLERARKGASTANILSVITSIETPSENEVVLKMSEPGGHLLGALSTEAGMIISPKGLAADDLGKMTHGAGPYRLTEYTPDKLTYEKWDGYWEADSVKNQDLEMVTQRDDATRLRALQSGQADAGYMRPTQVEQMESAGLEVMSKPRSLIYAVTLNASTPGFDKPEVRRALSQAIDRDSIADDLQAGGCTVSEQLYIDSYYPHITDRDWSDLAYDADAAKQALEDAGYDEKNPLTFEISSVNLSQYQELAAAVQDQFSKIGIKTELKTVESTTSTQEIMAGNYDAMVQVLDVGRPDPTSFVDEYLMKGGSRNPGGFTVPGTEQLLDQARTSVDPAEQAGPMHELLNKVYDAGSPVITICAPDNTIGLRSGVEGFEIPPLGTYDFRGVTVTD